MKQLEKSLLDLVRRATLELCHDVLTPIERAIRAEDSTSNAHAALEVILENIALARETQQPLCPDPVSAHFYVLAPTDFDPIAFRAAAEGAITEATKAGLLPEALVDPVTGRVVRGNVGPGSPTCHFTIEERKTLEVRLLLDSGIEVFPGAQYVLPDESIGAARDLNGVRRAALDTLVKTQGSGSGPGILAVGIGGDRATGYALAHEQLLRPLNDRNRTKLLADLEKRILEEANTLGIGPLGFGGKTTLLGVKVAAQAATLAHCFVSVCYAGWAHRRQGIEVDGQGAIRQWLYDETSEKHAARVAEKVATITAQENTPEEPAKPAAKKKSTARVVAKKANEPATASQPVAAAPDSAAGTAGKMATKKVAKKVTASTATKATKKAPAKAAAKATAKPTKKPAKKAARKKTG